MKFLKFRNIAGVLATAAMAVSLCACDDDEPAQLTEAIYPSSVELTFPDEVKHIVYNDESGIQVLPMIKGETYRLSALLHPDNVTFQDKLWMTSNPQNVAVDADGNITALSSEGDGYSMITVAPDPYISGSGISASIRVRVSDALVPATQIVVSSDNDAIYASQTMQMKASILPADATYRTVRWTSSDESIATVDENGVVTGMVTDAILAQVTITATAIDGSGVSGSKAITIMQIVQPQQITIDQAFAKGNYECAINEHKVALDFTTVPAQATTNLIEWTSSDESIATVADGVVTFNKNGMFGDFTITARCPETGNTATIEMTLPAGLHRELFLNEDDYVWKDNTGGSKTVWHPGYITITATGSDKLRQDFKCFESVYLHAGNYPIIAIRMHDLMDVPEVTARNIALDTSGKCEGKDFKGGLNGTNNKWAHDWKIDDGTHVFIYDLATQNFQTGGKLPTTAVATFGTFQFKYADIKPATTPLDYEVHWVQTFRTLEDVENYIASEGRTIENKIK